MDAFPQGATSHVLVLASGLLVHPTKITMIVDLHHRNSKLIKTPIAPLIHRAAQSQDVTDNATQRSLDVPDIYILCVWICSSLVHNGVGLE